MTSPSTTALGVGTELRAAREQAGISRQSLATMADCSINWVSQLELGLRPATSPALARVWRVLNALNGVKEEDAVV